MVENIMLTAAIFAIIFGCLPWALKDTHVDNAVVIAVLVVWAGSFATLIVSALMLIWANP